MMVIDLKNLINEICLIVKDCGKVILNADREKMAIDTKSGIADLVTEYDKNIQKQLEISLKKILPHTVANNSPTVSVIKCAG